MRTAVIAPFLFAAIFMGALIADDQLNSYSLAYLTPDGEEFIFDYGLKWNECYAQLVQANDRAFTCQPE